MSWSSCNYSCFMIFLTAKSVISLHLLLFYDSYDSNCIYSCFMILATAISVVFLHLLLFSDSYDSNRRGLLVLLFYDSYDSKRHGLLASTLVLWFPWQQTECLLFLHLLLFYDSYDSKKDWSSCIYSFFVIPTTAKRVVFLHLLLFDDLLYHGTVLWMCKFN